MEVFGGNGYVETGSMARLYREAPVNSIWEGSGNVMCLDVMRAIARGAGRGSDAARRARRRGLERRRPRARDRRAARLLARRRKRSRHGPAPRAAPRARDAGGAAAQDGAGRVADAFIATRLGEAAWGRVVGAIDARRVDVAALLARALPA
jgi:putative acyl-CoA dehydrogenase